MALGLPEVLRDLPETDAGAFADLEQSLGWTFSRPELLRCALTLGSWVNENRRQGWEDNACLEFFGDAVLDLVCAQALWVRFPKADEGALTRLRATLVSETGLCDVARGIHLGRFLFLGKGDEERGARDRPATLSDALEAVLGAVFLDAQEAGSDPAEVCTEVFQTLFGDRVAELQLEDGLDPKSRLQQVVQGRFRVTPTYEVLDQPEEGQPGEWKARVVAKLYPDREAVELGIGKGRSLREAQREAAGRALRGDKLL